MEVDISSSGTELSSSETQELVLAVKRVPSMKMLKTLTSSWCKEFHKNQKTYVKLGCQVGECQHYYAHHSFHLLATGLYNCVNYVFSRYVGIVEGEEGVDGHLFSVMLRVGVGLNSIGDLDEASSCSEPLLGAWARLEVAVGLQFTDLKLLVRGMQGVLRYNKDGLRKAITS